MTRKSRKDEDCPIARSLDEIGDWWTLLIVREAILGAERFGQFEKSTGAAKNILSARLRKMEADGILEVRNADGGGHYTYHLTAKGRELYVVLAALRQWAEDHLFEEGEPMTLMVDKETGRPVDRLEVTDRDGKPLTLQDLLTIAGHAGDQCCSDSPKTR